MPLDHEVYDIIVSNIAVILKKVLAGDITVFKYGNNIKVHINHQQFGNFIYTIYDVDEINLNEITSRDLAEKVVSWHKSCVVKKLFL